MSWKPTLNFDDEIVDYEPDRNSNFGNLFDDKPKIYYPRPEAHYKYAALQRQRRMEQESKLSSSQNHKLNIIANIQRIANSKPLNEQPKISDWDNDENVEQETIALMRHFGFGPSIEEPLDETRTIPTYPIKEGLRIMKTGEKQLPILFDDKFFKLKPRVANMRSDNSDSKNEGQKSSYADVKEKSPHSSRNSQFKNCSYKSISRETNMRSDNSDSKNEGQKSSNGDVKEQSRHSSQNSQSKNGEYISISKVNNSNERKIFNNSVNVKEISLKGNTDQIFLPNNIPNAPMNTYKQKFSSQYEKVQTFQMASEGQESSNADETGKSMHIKEKGQSKYNKYTCASKFLGSDERKNNNSFVIVVPPLCKRNNERYYANSKQNSLSKPNKVGINVSEKYINNKSFNGATEILCRGKEPQLYGNGKANSFSTLKGTGINCSNGRMKNGKQYFSSQSKNTLDEHQKSSNDYVMDNLKHSNLINVTNKSYKGNEKHYCAFRKTIPLLTPKRLEINFSNERKNEDFSSKPKIVHKFYTPRELYEMKLHQNLNN